MRTDERMDSEMDSKMDEDDARMNAMIDYEIDRHLVALNGLAVMLQMSDRRGHVTADMATHAAGMLVELAEWLKDKPGIDSLLPIDEVATLTMGRLKKRLAGLYSRLKEEEPKSVDAHVSGCSHSGQKDGVKLACAHVSGHSREQPLTSGQINQNNWGQGGSAENGDRVEPAAVMEALEGLASLVIGLQKNVDRVWLEVRRA